MFSFEVSQFLICSILACLKVDALADHFPEHYDSAGNPNHTNHASENNTISNNNTDTYLPNDGHETDEYHNKTEDDHITMERQDDGKRENELHHMNKSLQTEPIDIANITSYMQNLSMQSVDELRAIWCNQTHVRSLDEEENVIYQTYKVQLKRIRYLINRIEVLTAKQCKSIESLDWTKEDEEQPQPYHDDVINELAKYWNEIERYFRENKLRGVDVSIRRITRLVEKAKEELNGPWDRLKKLVAEMNRLKSLL